MQTGSLVVAGLGIKFKSHLTVEVEAYLREADEVFYLVNEPVTESWIKKYKPHAFSLAACYAAHHLRKDAYRDMTNRILQTLRMECHVCVLLYGHPTVFAKPALDAVLQAKREGYDARVLPGISAEDCLFADLLINPASAGCHSYEATDFLIHQRPVDYHGHLILWQVGIIGALNYPLDHDHKLGMQLLVSYLLKYYDGKHQVTLYEAAQYPHFNELNQTLPLEELPEANYSALTTLYIPPRQHASCNEEMLHALSIDIKDLNS